jgi:hypothetical protein
MTRYGRRRRGPYLCILDAVPYYVYFPLPHPRTHAVCVLLLVAALHLTTHIERPAFRVTVVPGPNSDDLCTRFLRA